MRYRNNIIVQYGLQDVECDQQKVTGSNCTLVRSNTCQNEVRMVIEVSLCHHDGSQVMESVMVGHVVVLEDT